MSDQATAWRRQAEHERGAAASTRLDRVRERHIRSAEALEELAARLEYVAAGRAARIERGDEEV